MSTIVPPLCHSIGFFKDDQQLCAEVGAFVAEGLQAGQPALIVTNEAHRLGIAAELRAQGLDPDAIAAAGDLLMVDAQTTLDLLMNGGDMPDADLYHQNVGAACAELLGGRPGPLRIFGDMVDLLWQRGQYDAAVRIEILSNQLAAIHPISVICGYSMGHFLKTAAQLAVVRDLHGRVHEPTTARRDRSVAADRPLRTKDTKITKATKVKN